MRFFQLTSLASLLGLLSVTPVSAQNCGDGSPLSLHLNWSTSDHGFNEGAECGARALFAAQMEGVPNMVPQPVLGNLWDRTDMMALATDAFSQGKYEAAIDVAICSQVHNQPIHTCLQQNRDGVQEWFRARVAAN